MESGRDTTLKGAIVSGNTVVADIGTNPDTGGNLRLESEQDSANYKSKNTSVSGGISYTFGAGGFGGSISSGKEKIDSTYNSVIEQTAIQAGNGGFDINVAGNTHLKGAVIDSTLAAQVAGNNQLTTATLTTDNIENKGEYKASSSTMGVNVNGNANTNADNPAGGSIGSSLKAGLGGMGVADSGEEHGTTKAAIANADITITDDTAQKELTGKDAVTTVATLDRDTQHANGSIENPFNLEKVQEQLEFLQVAGETIVVPAMAQAAKWIGDQFPPDPEHPDRIDPAKVLAHAVLGAAVSQLLGTGWQTGAAAGALGDVLPAVLAKAFEKDENGKIKDEAAFKAASAIISAMLASGSGADLAQTINAAMITQNAVENNWLKHQEIKIGKDALASCQTLECKTNVTKALQSLDAEREEQKVRAEYIAKSAYDMEVRGCEGDSACIAKYQNMRYQAEDYLHDVYVQYISGEISDEKFTGGMQVALALALDGATDHAVALKNLTWEQVQQGLVASYTSVKNTVTAEVPAFEIEKSFGEFLANAQTDKAIGGLAFDVALGSVVGYAGGKVVGWTAEKGWETLAPALAEQAEQFLKSQGLIFNAVPEGPRTYIRPNANAEEVRSLTRENESADILAANNYKVEQNPVVNSSSEPDYRINGEIYDNYAPKTSNVRNIWDVVRDKVVVKQQADSIVINLADSHVSVRQLEQQFANYPINGLKDLIVIDKHGEIIKFKVK